MARVALSPAKAGRKHELKTLIMFILDTELVLREIPKRELRRNKAYPAYCVSLGSSGVCRYNGFVKSICTSPR